MSNRYFKLKMNKIQLIFYKLALPVFFMQEIALLPTQLLKSDICVSLLASFFPFHSPQMIHYQVLSIPPS